MVCTDQNNRVGNATHDGNAMFCSSCAAKSHLFISLLDSRTGKQYRVYRCECGTIIWDDREPGVSTPSHNPRAGA